jgi:hypothetical protein
VPARSAAAKPNPAQRSIVVNLTRMELPLAKNCSDVFLERRMNPEPDEI